MNTDLGALEEQACPPSASPPQTTSWCLTRNLALGGRLLWDWDEQRGATRQWPSHAPLLLIADVPAPVTVTLGLLRTAGISDPYMGQLPGAPHYRLFCARSDALPRGLARVLAQPPEHLARLTWAELWARATQDLPRVSWLVGSAVGSGVLEALICGVPRGVGGEQVLAHLGRADCQVIALDGPTAPEIGPAARWLGHLYALPPKHRVDWAETAARGHDE